MPQVLLEETQSMLLCKGSSPQASACQEGRLLVLPSGHLSFLELMETFCCRCDKVNITFEGVAVSGGVNLVAEAEAPQGADYLHF